MAPSPLPAARGVIDLALAIILSLLAFGLAIVCIVHAAATYYAFKDPIVALQWNASEPDALSTLAAKRSQDAETQRGHAEAVEYARRALRAAPLDGQALRVLALETENQGDGEGAARLMTLAGERSQRDVFTQLWLFAHAMTDGDAEIASLRADALLRRQPELAPLLFPSIEKMLRDPAATSPYVARLAQAPDWRRPFLSELARGGDVGAARAVFTSLTSTRAPPTDDELGFLVARLIADGDYRGARALWTRSDRALFDGNFQGLGGPLPFSWRLTNDQGAVAESARTPDGRTALHVQAPATSTSTLAEQLLVLPPGGYRISGEVLADAGPATSAFSWSVTCAPGNDRLGADTGGPSDSAAWKAFSITFGVPSSGCAGQWLRLNGVARDGFDTASAWYRGLRLDSLSGPVQRSR